MYKATVRGRNGSDLPVATPENRHWNLVFLHRDVRFLFLDSENGEKYSSDLL